MSKPWWLRLVGYTNRRWPSLGFAGLLMLVGVGLEVLKPWPVKLIVDHTLRERPLPEAASWITALSGDATGGQLAWLAAAMVVLFAAVGLLQVLKRYVNSGLGAGLTYDLGGALFGHLQRLSLSFHRRRAIGDLVRRVCTDSQCVQKLVMGVCLPAVTAVVTLGAMFAVMWHLDPSLSLLALLVVLPLGLAVRLFVRPMTDRTYQQQEQEGRMMAMAEQNLSAVDLVQSFGREDYEHERFRDQSRRTLRAYLEALRSQLQFNVSVSSITALGTAVVMAVGGLHALDGSLTLGGLLVYLSYLASLYAPVETLAYLASDFASAAAGGKRVLDVFDSTEAVPEVHTPTALPRRSQGAAGRIRFEQVQFGYRPDRPVLKGIDLEAHPGEVLALAGPSGAGKSTLAALILRFMDPSRGRVTFDGCDLRELKVADLRARIALLPQEPFLLPLTVAQNIAYGRPDATGKDIAAAAETAHADRFIEALPQGYDTVLAERGAALSGGQRQRLAIARALLKGGDVLILDEPTSALDAETEASLMDALARLMAGRTTFIIAHRLSTLRRADRIVVLDNGYLVEDADRRVHLMAEGLFKRAAHRQATGHEAPPIAPMDTR